MFNKRNDAVPRRSTLALDRLRGIEVRQVSDAGAVAGMRACRSDCSAWSRGTYCRAGIVGAIAKGRGRTGYFQRNPGERRASIPVQLSVA